MKEPYKTDPDDLTRVYIKPTLSVQRVVVCAANRIGDVILCGARHWDEIMHKQADAMGLAGSACDAEQGFIDQYGQFMDRREAKVVALASGQKLRDPIMGDLCFSENLY